MHNEKAILLANLMVDTSKPIKLAIPDSLRAPPNNGTYVVQSRADRLIDLRAMKDANATILLSGFLHSQQHFLVRVWIRTRRRFRVNPADAERCTVRAILQIGPVALADGDGAAFAVAGQRAVEPHAFLGHGPTDAGRAGSARRTG